MKDEDIFKDLNKLGKQDIIYKSDLLAILKKYGRTVSPFDLMQATNLLQEDGKYIQDSYRDKFLKTYLRYFIIRLKDILNNDDDVDGTVNKELLDKSLDKLENQFHKESRETKKNSKFPLIYTLTSLYSTFIMEEPIHPEGSEFPGSQKVYKEKGTYYCPVKKNQMKNPNALCKFCLAKQMPK